VTDKLSLKSDQVSFSMLNFQ